MSIHNPGIVSLSFGFENCDNADIRVSFIGLFQIKNISLSLGKIECCNSKDMMIDYHKSCDSFMISLYRTYNNVWKKGGGRNGFNHYEDLFERLKHNDIVDVSVKKSNDIVETIHLPYDGEYTNKNQKTVQNKFGDLFIFVNKQTDHFDYYSDEFINDEYNMKQMFSISELDEYSKQFSR